MKAGFPLPIAARGIVLSVIRDSSTKTNTAKKLRRQVKRALRKTK
jgi:hypothetical protein